jgi:hypothetical protein
MVQTSLFETGAKRRLTLQERFDRWVAANPHIIEHFRRFAREVKRSGARQYGIKAIAERVRWHVRIEKGEEDFKVDNNYMSRLSRLLVERDPALAGMFSFRALRKEHNTAIDRKLAPERKR